MEEDWYKWPVMYCFHRMPSSLKTSLNRPQSCSAAEMYSGCDKQRGERGRRRGGREAGTQGEMVKQCDRVILQKRMNCKYWPCRGEG